MNGFTRAEAAIKGWTATRCERLEELWANGRSCSQIAVEIGGISRNAVIGKIHRIGLPRPERKPKAPRGPAAGGGRRYNLGQIFRTAPKPEPVYHDPALQISFMALQSHHCRWIVGDVFGIDTIYCGAPKFEDKPYCGRHSRMAFNKARPANPIETAKKMQAMRRQKQAKLLRAS